MPQETEHSASPPTMTAKKVAHRLGLRLHRVYELTRRGILPHFRLGRQIRYDRQELEKFIRSGGTADPERGT